MVIDSKSSFFTLKGYQLCEKAKVTAAMEDYLEMICRIIRTQPFIRINNLAERLNVKPSSASKMVSNLKELGLVDFERYGYIKPTEKGKKIGEYLLYRHDVLHKFLCLINHSDNELEQVEKIEHFFNEMTIRNIEKSLDLLKKQLYDK